MCRKEAVHWIPFGHGSFDEAPAFVEKGFVTLSCVRILGNFWKWPTLFSDPISTLFHIWKAGVLKKMITFFFCLFFCFFSFMWRFKSYCVLPIAK